MLQIPAQIQVRVAYRDFVPTIQVAGCNLLHAHPTKNHFFLYHFLY